MWIVSYRNLHNDDSSSAATKVGANHGLPSDSFNNLRGRIRNSSFAPQVSEPEVRRIETNPLTSVLANQHSAYIRTRFRHKRDLGRIHPTALKNTSGWRYPPTSMPKDKRIRTKLSNVFAIYVESVSSVPCSSERSSARLQLSHYNDSDLASTAGIHESAFPADLVDNQMHSLADATEPRSKAATLQELYAIKRLAVAQSEVVPTETLSFLAWNGYTLTDFAVWNWILSGTAAEEAASRLQLARRPACKANVDLGPVPIFIFQKLLLRNDMTANALAILIRQIWQLLNSINQSGSNNNDTEGNNSDKKVGPIGLDALTTMVVRLLRQSRTVWPAAITSIAELWVTHAKNKETEASRLCFHYNRILRAIALPPNESPYQSVHYRQRAQLILYRRMMDPSSPITINREGYRAMALVQLAHRKTDSEREWARLKAPSWPPWKVNRTGMDAHVAAESGISRATTVLHEATDRGYGPRAWEKGAGILAGTDTDQSPTIQTRSVAVPNASLSLPRGSMASLAPDHLRLLDRTSMRLWPDAAVVWVARVKATRTLQEAWVCFLACRDEGTTMTPQLYEAMLEKVIYDDKRRQSTPNDVDVNAHVGSTSKQLAMPGDGKEVAESSASHNQIVSTREPLPTLNSLLEQMVHHDMRPSGRLLELLLTHARSYEEGVKALELSTLEDSVRSIFLHWQGQRWDQAAVSDIRALLKTLPDWLFVAYIKFLCRFAETGTAPHDGNACIQGRLENAFRLVVTRLPTYRPPWNCLLELLSRPGTTVFINKRSRLQQNVVKFERACRILDSMDSLNLDMDFTGFSYLCAIVSNANAAASYKDCGRDQDNDKATRARTMLESRAKIVKTRFAQLVRPSYDLHTGLDTVARLSDYHYFDSRIDECPGLPRLFRVPNPAHLHVYIRCLGKHDDYDGLMELMHWLTLFIDEVIVEAKEVANGRTMFRRCLIALRAFGCNESIQSVGGQTEQYEAALNSLLEEIDNREDWDTRGGWPTDEEVDEYSNKGEKVLG